MRRQRRNCQRTGSHRDTRMRRQRRNCQRAGSHRDTWMRRHRRNCQRAGSQRDTWMRRHRRNCQRAGSQRDTWMWRQRRNRQRAGNSKTCKGDHAVAKIKLRTFVELAVIDLRSLTTKGTMQVRVTQKCHRVYNKSNILWNFFRSGCGFSRFGTYFELERHNFRHLFAKLPKLSGN